MRELTMLQNGESLQLCERGTHSVAKVAVQVNNIFEMVNVELNSQEYQEARNGRMKREIIDRAMLTVTG